MYKSIITIAFILISLLAQAQLQHELDLLHLALNREKTDTGRIHTIIEIANICLNKTDFTDKLGSTDFFINKAQQLNKKYRVAESQNRINILFTEGYWINSGTGRDAGKFFLPAIAECRKSGDNRSESLALKYLADMNPDVDKVSSFRLTCKRGQG